MVQVLVLLGVAGGGSLFLTVPHRASSRLRRAPPRTRCRSPTACGQRSGTSTGEEPRLAGRPVRWVASCLPCSRMGRAPTALQTIRTCLRSASWELDWEVPSDSWWGRPRPNTGGSRVRRSIPRQAPTDQIQRGTARMQPTGGTTESPAVSGGPCAHPDRLGKLHLPYNPDRQGRGLEARWTNAVPAAAFQWPAISGARSATPGWSASTSTFGAPSFGRSL
jgi:hypothetical protein